MSAVKTGSMATYKGRQYRVIWTGPTKYGERCKLAYMDGSKEFWVDASSVSSASSTTVTNTRRSSGNGCPCCGKNRRLVRDMEDGCYKCYECCDMPPD